MTSFKRQKSKSKKSKNPYRFMGEQKKSAKLDKSAQKYHKFLSKIQHSKSRTRKKSVKKSRNTIMIGNANERHKTYFKQHSVSYPYTKNHNRGKSKKSQGNTSRNNSKVNKPSFVCKKSDWK